jgi:hypothetical protein
MRYLLILGNGIDGMGLTRNAIELENYVNSTGNTGFIIANKDASCERGKLIDHNIQIVSFANEWDRLVEYIDNCDKVIVCSVPFSKYEEQTKTNFINILDYAHNIGKKIIQLQFDHKIYHIKRSVYAEDDYIKKYFDSVDLILTHTYEGDFCKKFIEKRDIKTNIIAKNDKNNNFFSIDFDSIKPIWKPFSEKEYKSIRFLGRAVEWKGPYLLRDLHWKCFKNHGYITYIEGFTMVISTAWRLCTSLKPKIFREDNILVCSNKETTTKFKKGEYEFKRNSPAYILPPYVRKEGLERMSKTMFGCELITMADYTAKDMIENVMFEIVASGTVPVFRKHWAEIYTLNGKPLIEYGSENIGTIFVDEDNPSEAVELMNKLANDEEQYELYRNNAYKFYKSIFDNSVILPQLLELINNA